MWAVRPAWEGLRAKVTAKGLNVLSRDLSRRGGAMGQEGREVRDAHIVEGAMSALFCIPLCSKPTRLLSLTTVVDKSG